MPEANPDLTTQRQKERERLIALHAKCPTDDKNFPYSGVLLSDGIRYCVREFDMIRPFDEQNLKPANYKITIGNQYAMDGEIHELSDTVGKNEIVIPPFQVVVIKTRETINMPRFLIARWNIRVELAYKGLLWVGGPQVDAGFVGYLACPVYNLSNKEVRLSYGDPIAVIDFVRTSSFTEGESLIYRDIPPERFMFEDYRPRELNSALYEVATKSVKDFRDQLSKGQATTEAAIKDIQTRVDYFVLITFTVIAVLFAAVTIFVTRAEQFSLWNPALFLISLTAIFISVFAWTRSDFPGRIFRNIVQGIVVLFLLFATAYHLWSTWPVQQQINDLRKDVELLKKEKPSSSSVTVLPNAAESTPSGVKTVDQKPNPNSTVPKADQKNK